MHPRSAEHRGIIAYARNAKSIEWTLTIGVRVAFLLAPIYLAMFTRQSALLIFILTNLLIIQYILNYKDTNSFTESIKMNILEIMIVTYLIFNSYISPNLLKAYVKTAFVFYIFAAVYFSIRGIASFSQPTIFRFTNRLVIGTLIGGTLAAIEIMLDYPLTKQLFEASPWLYSEKHKGIIVSGDSYIRVLENFFNRNAACLVLILWPAFLLSGNSASKIRKIHPNIIIFAAVFACVAYSESMTAKLALGGGILVFLLSKWRAHLARNLLVASWVAASLFAVPLAHGLHASGLSESGWVPHSARARIVIWHHTAEKVAERPFFGAGIRSTQYYQKLENNRSAARGAVGQDASKLQPRLGWHAHNLYLQTWFELGLVGVVLLIALGVSTLRRVALMPDDVQPYGYALFASASTVLAFGWGMWQTWLLMSIMFAVLALALANQAGCQPAE